MFSPIAISRVVSIGGPTGPSDGPTGSTGPLNSSETGATGSLGALGVRGATGYRGPVGIASLVTGATGVDGPEAFFGYVGPAGMVGAYGPVTPDRMAYFENTSGVSTAPGSLNPFAGCKFRYATKKLIGRIVILFSGIVTPAPGEQVRLQLVADTGSAPNAGDNGPSGPAKVLVKTPAASLTPYAIPFLMWTGLAYDGGTYHPNVAVGTDYWFDIAMDVDAGVSSLSNINAILMEF